MRIIPENTNIPFMSFRGIGFIVSTVLIAASIFFWMSRGESKYGLDFLGGAEVVVKFDKAVDAGAIRKALSAAGMSDAVVQKFGTGVLDQSGLTDASGQEFSIRIKKSLQEVATVSAEDAKVGKKIREALGTIDGVGFELLKEDSVGAVIGKQIRQDGLTALVVALLIILVYISVRFEFRFAIGAIIALVHDIIITSGVYVASGREISAAVLAGLLTIVGYSLNDTIIVYDRIRENIEKDIKKYGLKKGAGTSLSDLINLSINQTLSRTFLTSLTTFFVVFVLFVFGGGAVADLAFTLVIGVIVGTYSSIFIASPILLNFAAKVEE